MDEEKRSPSRSDEKADDVVVFVDDANSVVQDAEDVPKLDKFARKVANWITRHGLEGHGVDPVPVEQRTDPRIYQMFFVWFTANFNILSLNVGTVGPAVFGLGMRDTFITIVFVDIIACAFPAFFVILGPKLGTRAMVQSRFSWGYYGSIIPSVLNVLSMQGYCIVNCIIGGQTLASVSPHLNDTAGIVITGLISFGLLIDTQQITVHFLGAAITVGALVVPAWNAGFDNGNNVGGLVAAVLAPAGGFGRFLLVLMALSTPSGIAPTMYTVCTSFMTIAAVFSRVPRCVFAAISTAV
ncbi:hypothetical protein EIP86_009339 [Pleurotus ostreatoroseus]|nr:hypothetical protein EIP86_009339 [Pleurotus ostreatoroseus]